MIAAGMDPTQIAEATAAGADAGLAGDTGQGGHTFVVVNQDAARGEVTPGFATNTFANPGTENREYTGDRFFLTPEEETCPLQQCAGYRGRTKYPEPERSGVWVRWNKAVNRVGPPAITTM